MTPAQVATALLDYVATKAELQPQLATSLVHAMKDSVAFRITDAAWFKLREFDDLTLQQSTTLLEAAEEQDQVFRAGVGGPGGSSYRSVIADFLDKQAAAVPLARASRNSGSSRTAACA